ncbi:SOS response-associated peptidase [Novosphingobium huizhouense]|uniref:SOS response-associated peptidase n=1 Tax=Novosphingobium huizhouense TaxID=2866625 RepID=UPI001CD8B0AB|nr:SOS response-associated peptidase family protein [Novosphingobium huizhouense]
MCNLYRMTSNAQAIAALFGVASGGRNLPAFHEIYPGHEAPVLLDASAPRLDVMRWGWPPFGQVKRPITNVRNLASPMWRAAIADPARRCLVPVTEFSEWSSEPDPVTGRKVKHWFALRDHPLFAFAGLWRPTPEGPRFAFLTCEANRVVGAVHPKAMPVILRPGEEAQRWLGADGEAAAALQCSFPDALMAKVTVDDPPPTQGTLL